MNSIKLTLHEREIEFNFGLAFVGKLLDDTGLTLEEIVEKMKVNPFKMVPTTMFLSAELSAERKQETLDFDLYSLIDWIDESGGINQDVITLFLETFYNSLLKNVPKSKEQGKVDPKKKLKS